MLWRIVKESLGPLKHIVIILIGFSTQAETNAFLPIVFHSPEKQKAPSITICPYCCSYSDQQSLLESFIDWLNTWLRGISGINYYLFIFKSPFSDWISGFWSSSGKSAGTISECRDFWLKRSKLKWRARWWWSKWKTKGLLRNTQMAFELRPGFWEKL